MKNESHDKIIYNDHQRKVSAWLRANPQIGFYGDTYYKMVNGKPVKVKAFEV